MATIAMPDICVSCGKNRGTEILPFSFKISSLNPVSAATIFAGILVTRVTTYQMPLPICKECNQNKTTKMVLRYSLMGLSILVSLVAAVMYSTASKNDPAFEIRIQIMCISAMITLLLPFGLVFIDPPLCSVRNDYFKFKNAIFQDQFAQLNPGLVRSKRK